MGAEATCTATFNGKTATGKCRLETDALQFRGGDLRLSIPFKQMSKIAARGGTLSVTFPDGTASFDLGAAAPRWARNARQSVRANPQTTARETTGAKARSLSAGSRAPPPTGAAEEYGKIPS